MRSHCEVFFMCMQASSGGLWVECGLYVTARCGVSFRGLPRHLQQFLHFLARAIGRDLAVVLFLLISRLFVSVSPGFGTFRSLILAFRRAFRTFYLRAVFVFLGFGFVFSGFLFFARFLCVAGLGFFGFCFADRPTYILGFRL